MAENLKTTRYRNGNVIGTTTPPTKVITNENTPQYLWSYDGNESNVSTYGRLYTWYAITDSRNVCPTGWHVPTLDEWTVLTTYLGGESVAGGKLRETGTAHWHTPNTSATNETGFTALPGGSRDYNYTLPFDYLGATCEFWAATEYDTLGAWSFTMESYTPRLYIGVANKRDGYSVRCVKDN